MALRAVRENPVAVPGANATECPSMTTSFKQFIADEAGATAIKYGLIAAAFRLRSLPRERAPTKLNTKVTSINTSLK
jgi:hypothetical protein